jgi:acetoacetyl-CoA synthetase
MNPEPIWTPNAARVAASNMRRFLNAHAARLDSPDYAGLYRWSLAHPEEFWPAVVDFCGIYMRTHERAVVEHWDDMPNARWFPGATLNYAENLLRSAHTGAALIFVSETGERLELDWAELRRQVASVAAGLRALGVARGDRVAAWLPNRPETVVVALATASIGAVWSSCSPDFGKRAVLDRFGQIAPKVLIAADGYFYDGKRIDCLPVVAEVAKQLPGLAALFVIGYAQAQPDLTRCAGARHFAELLGVPAKLEFAPLEFDDPLFILYSSGTTGAPKCIVHGVGGTLLQHQKEHVLHTDIKPGDVVFYFTTCGWMMWNWLLSTLGCGATVVLFDGAPFHPDPGVLWRIAERESIKVFGTSARYLSALQSHAYAPRAHVRLDALATILSTGSPLAPASFDFVYANVKADVQLASIAGGTDLISCFALGNPLLPVHRGELQCRGLGMAVQIYDASGRAVVGEKGELVCTAPFPSRPIGFWNDPGRARYKRAYFERFPNVWCHGDYAELTPGGGIVIYGRSDAVLNPGGVRIGTAEIYRVVEELPEIAESVAVDQEWDGDTRIVLFVRLAPGAVLDETLRARIRAALRTQASPRHVPAKVIAVEDIPRTLNGKVVELAVRDAVHGREPGNLAVLANPESRSPTFATVRARTMSRPRGVYDARVCARRARGRCCAGAGRAYARPPHADLLAASPALAWLPPHRLASSVRDHAATRGVYLWGGVGRGKTLLMDLFYGCLPFEDKTRQHFHRFMAGVHGNLKTLKDQPNPLDVVADRLAERTRIICFDEFAVGDIADAMILGNLLTALFARGVTLAATSNIRPQDLYRNGLQRQQFLPAIHLIERHTDVLHVEGQQDYRLRVLERADVYQFPSDAAAERHLAEYFAAIAPDEPELDGQLEVLGREIPYRCHADGVIWFDFRALCDGPRSQDDYIELSRCYQTVLVSNVPQLDATLENQAHRFIALVDEFYDRRVKLILSASVPLDALYRGKRLQHDFARTRSRLQEMQSYDYLAAAHRA